MEPYYLTILYFAIGILIVCIGLAIFEALTKQYKDWEEIQKGNHAVALSITGKIIGICIILAFSIYHSSHILDTIIWGIFGVALQMITYLLFELFTRRFSVEEQLLKGNIAVGIVSFGVSVGLAFVIGASIT